MNCANVTLLEDGCGDLMDTYIGVESRIQSYNSSQLQFLHIRILLVKGGGFSNVSGRCAVAVCSTAHSYFEQKECHGTSTY